MPLTALKGNRMKRLSLFTALLIAICSPAAAQVSGGVTVFGNVNNGDLVTLRNKAQIQALTGSPLNGQCVVYTGVYPSGTWGPGPCVAAGAGTVTSAVLTVGTGLTATDMGAGALCNTATMFGCLVNINSATQITSFNGRFGAVVPATSDYNFNQLAGILGCAQLPAFTTDITNVNCAMTIPNGTVTSAKMAAGAAAANLGNYVSSFNTRTGAVVPGSSDYISSQINNTSAGTGGQTRTELNKWGDFLTTADYSTGTTLYNAAVAAGVGMVFVPKSASAPTLPTTFTDAAFFYMGPLKTYSMTQTDPFSGTDTAQSMKTGIIAQHAGSHTTNNWASFNVSTRAVGSGANGPLAADVSYNCSNVKINYPASAAQGQLNCYFGFIRNTGADGVRSDAAFLEGNVANSSNTGQMFFFEGVTTNFDRAGTTFVRSLDVQGGVLDTIANHGWGFVAASISGNSDQAYLGQESVGSTFADYLRYITSEGTTRYNVSRLGQTNAGSYRINGTASPTIACTGLGSTGSCTKDTGSGDSAGSITFAPGGTGIAGSGTITITYSAAIGSNGSSCFFTAANGSAGWTAPTSFISGGNSTTSFNVTWANNSGATGLSSGQSYIVKYLCMGY